MFCTRLDAFFTLVEYGRTISREMYNVSRATVQANSNYLRLTRGGIYAVPHCTVFSSAPPVELEGQSSRCQKGLETLH